MKMEKKWQVQDTSIPLYKPHRWDIKNSYQYTLKALIMRNNECLDEVELKFGVRTFCCDPGRGFLINGNCVPLRGVSRHQDKLYRGKYGASCPLPARTGVL